MQSETELLNKIAQVYADIHNAHREQLSIWIEHVVFSWKWWFSVGLTVLPWMFWFFVRKKESRNRLLTAGLVVMFISSWLDYYGVILGLWHYNYDVLPTLPAFVPWDLTLLPVLAMILLQIKPKVNFFIKAIVFACITAFVAEPIFTWLKTYSPDHWRFIYSFPLFLGIYLLAHYTGTRNGYAPLDK